VESAAVSCECRGARAISAPGAKASSPTRSATPRTSSSPWRQPRRRTASRRRLASFTIIPGIGVHAPAILIIAFIPDALHIAWLPLSQPRRPRLRAPTFAWVTGRSARSSAWVNGWAIFLADVIVMASLADIASIYTFKLVGWTGRRETPTSPKSLGRSCGLP